MDNSYNDAEELESAPQAHFRLALPVGQRALSALANSLQQINAQFHRLEIKC
jgi:hypothetical protein